MGKFASGPYEKHLCEIILNLNSGLVVQEKMPFKDISCLQLQQPFCLVEQNHLDNCGRGYYEDHFGEIILHTNQ